MNSPIASKLKIIRPRNIYVDRLRSYKIYVDNMLVGTIAPESVLEVEISSGNHLVHAAVDWCRSKPLNCNITQGQVAQIEVNNHWGALLSIWAITFGMGSYLKLKLI